MSAYRQVVSGMHFERMAADYVSARPPYPPALFQTLKALGVTGPGTDVLEIGAGAGLATRELLDSGSSVVAIEPGRDLAAILERSLPNVPVLVTRLEDAELPVVSFHSAVAATSMHWVDLATALPKLHAALRPSGWLAVWRHRFGDEGFDTSFRRQVEKIVGHRGAVAPRPGDRPTMEELAEGGWFEPVRSETWRWSMEMDADKIRNLFRTFSEWDDSEVAQAGRAVEDLGGIVTEHYQTVLRVLRRSSTSGF
jgi:SAM-dependent methyltransferase